MIYSIQDAVVGNPRGKGLESLGRTRLYGSITCTHPPHAPYYELVSKVETRSPLNEEVRRSKLYPSDLHSIVPMYHKVWACVNRYRFRNGTISANSNVVTSYLSSLLTVISLLESRWDSKAINQRSGAIGAFQMMPSSFLSPSDQRSYTASDFSGQCIAACSLIERVIRRLTSVASQDVSWRGRLLTSYRILEAVCPNVSDFGWGFLSSNPSLCYVPMFWSGGYSTSLGSISYAALVFLIQRLVMICVHN
jgi:hypothetical protein